MTTKPTKFLNWLVGNVSPFSAEPGNPLKQAGWSAGEAPGANHHNWMFANLDQWNRVLAERDQYDFVVGPSSSHDFATLAACIASSSVYGGNRILVVSSIVLAAELVISKGLTITFARGAGINGVAATPAIRIKITTANVEIIGGTFNDYNTNVFYFDTSATNCSIRDISTNQKNVFDDYAVTAGYKPVVRNVRINNN